MGTEALRNLPKSSQLVTCGALEPVFFTLCAKITQWILGLEQLFLNLITFPASALYFSSFGFPLSLPPHFLAFYSFTSPLLPSPPFLFSFSWAGLSPLAQHRMKWHLQIFLKVRCSHKKLWLWKVLDDMEKAGSWTPWSSTYLFDHVSQSLSSAGTQLTLETHLFKECNIKLRKQDTQIAHIVWSQQESISVEWRLERYCPYCISSSFEIVAFQVFICIFKLLYGFQSFHTRHVLPCFRHKRNQNKQKASHIIGEEALIFVMLPQGRLPGPA